MAKAKQHLQDIEEVKKITSVPVRYSSADSIRLVLVLVLASCLCSYIQGYQVLALILVRLALV